MTANSKKLKATANIAKNRLYITIAGKLTKENLDKLYTDIRFCVADLAKVSGLSQAVFDRGREERRLFSRRQ